MALVKAKFIKHVQRKYQVAAIDFIQDLYFRLYNVNKRDFSITWFAYTDTGWKCMVTSDSDPNNFYEITKNEKTNETTCSCLNRYAYFVEPDPSEGNLLSSKTLKDY